jgi:hypothetical protein
VVLVHQGSVEQGDAFFEPRWPEVAAIADPDLRLYGAFGLGAGRLSEVIGIRAILSSFRALFRGNFAGRPIGDVKVMPGAFLIAEGRVVWRHDYAHSGERPDWRAALAVVG